MTITLSNVLAVAGALWRRDRDLLVRIAFPFILLPSLALQLLVPPLAVSADTAPLEQLRLQSQFVGDHAGAYLLAFAVSEYGRAALLAGYLDPGAGDVRGSLRRALVLAPRFWLLSLLVQMATGAGLLLFAIPGLLIAGRTLLAGAAMLAGGRSSAIGSLRRAWALTRGYTPATAALAALLIGGRLVALYPVLAMDRWLRALNEPNPVALAVVDGAAAGVEMLAAIAGVLVAVTLYRALSVAGASKGT